MEKSKIIVGWIVLIILFILLIGINYIKYTHNKKSVETKTNNEYTETKKLEQITNKFNESNELKQMEIDNQVKVKAINKNNSLYITYTDKTDTTTYEFIEKKNLLVIKINNNKDNLEKFKKIFTLLVGIVQKELNNTIDITPYANELIERNTNYNAIYVEVLNNINTYYIKTNIKLEENK